MVSFSHRFITALPPRWAIAAIVFAGAIATAAGSRAEDGPIAPWAFRPPADPAVPAVRDASWPSAPLDRFILAKLEANGLRPAPPADKRTLLRRITFDLTGLPPTPEEVEEFLNDRSPEAFSMVVDRLLGSPRYGERWGRHWLDVARYADSNGLDENVAHGNAWRYRDYVVSAFNRDKPYDRFLLEQIAGDLLEPGGDSERNESVRSERLIATGFLALGPKVLAEVDERKMEMDIVDEQVDTLGRAVMALTLGCARCHDHKFDPISTEDYHAVAGIFKSTRTMESFKKVARWHESSLATDEDLTRKAEHEKQVAEQKARVESVVQRTKERLAAAAAPGSPAPKDPEAAFPADAKAELKRLREELARIEASAPVMPSAMGVAEGQPCDLPVHLRGSHLDLGRVVPRGFPAILAAAEPKASSGKRLDTKQSGRLELARWLVRSAHPLTSRVIVNRVWRWHFGRGLVPSVDNFGRLGEPPADPALLDWLAHRFVEAGLSLKRLHRLMLLSSTYRMSAEHDPPAARVDPENRLHWRSNVRRLEAEAIRDSLLAAGGLLDLAMGGSLLHVKNRDYFFDHTSRDTTRYDSLRRSIYLPVVRNHLYDVFQLFDFTDATVSSGDRSTTTVAPQALFHLNSGLVAQAAGRIASDLLGVAALDDAGRIERLYRLAYSRPASPPETARARAFLESSERELRGPEADGAGSRLEAWALLCHAVLSASEFVYVE